jgi:hypothetical protein
MQPTLVQFPTLAPECHDTEARSLKKIDALQYQVSATLAALAKPGGAQVALTKYVYGISYQVPQGEDLLDISCYNPNDVDCWVFIIMSVQAPQPGMPPTFPIRVYGHNHSYYEAMASALSLPSGESFSIAVSSNETTLVWNANPVFLAIRHS